MEKKIKNLTELISDGTVSNEINSGKIAIANKAYEQAWKHLYKAYTTSNATYKQKGEAAYFLYTIMRDVSSDDQIIREIADTDNDLKIIGKNKTLTNDYIRRYIGRKYLKESAENGYDKGLMEYGLSCVDCGEPGSFTYEYNDKNAEAGLAWADKMLSSSNKYVQHAGYIIYAKYYFVKGLKENSSVYVKGFGDNILKAKNLLPANQYTQYFLGHLYSNPKFNSYNNGTYSNIRTGYDYFVKASKFSTDPAIVKSAEEIKHMMETKFPSIIR